MREGVRLIESARGKAAAVEGNRHEKIGLDQKFIAGACHPCPERFGKFHSVVVFQSMHQLPHRAILEMRDCPGAVINRWIGNCLGRQKPVVSEIHSERRAETFAKRALDETHLRPTGCAKRVRSAGGLAAIEAGGRKYRVYRGVR